MARLFVCAVVCALALSGMTPDAAVHASMLETIGQANDAFGDGDYEKSAELYKALIETNPYKWRYWDAYAYSNHVLGNYDEAIRAWTRCLELGHQRQNALYNIACANALLGNTETAMDFLERAYAAGYVAYDNVRQDSDLDGLRDLDRFKHLTGLGLPELDSREARWAADLDHFARRMEQVHWDLYANISQPELQRELSQLKARVAALEDHEVKTALQRIVARIGDGHTTVISGWHGHNPETTYPVDFYSYPEGIYVRAATPDYKDAVGKRVVAVGGVDVDAAFDRVAELVSRDNEMWVKFVAPRIFRNPEKMSAIGLAPSPDALRLTLAGGDGRHETVTLQAVPLEERENLVWAHASDSAPLYLRHTDDLYWFEHLHDINTVYFQYNGVRNKEDESLADFVTRLFAFIDENDVERLVIDIRHNHGGNNFLNRPLIHAILKNERINQRGNLFVIAGRETFSAAMNCAADLDYQTNALFVGEPTGSRPNFVGETSIIMLPYSNTAISCSSRYHQNSFSTDRRMWIAPDLIAELTWADYAANRDPVMALIREEILAMGAR